MMKTRLSILILFTAICAMGQNLNSSLTACYSLNGNATDAINSLNGILSAVTPTVDRFNNAGSAMHFSGSTSSYVQLPNSPLLKPANAISVSLWCRASAMNNWMDLVFTKNAYSSYFTAYSLTIQDNGAGYKFRVYRQYGFGEDYVDGTTTVMANTWYHIVFTIDNASMNIYVNGVLENTTMNTNSNFNYDATRNVILGGTNESASNSPYLGTLDNLRFYNRVISSAEVSALYNQDPQCLVAAPVSSFSVSAIKVCQGATVSATDLSSNGPTAWNWQVTGTAAFSSTVSNPAFTLTAPGNYILSLVSSNTGGSSNTATQSIVVVPNPTVSVIPSQVTACAGSAVNLFASGAATYSWSNSQTGPSIVVIPSSTTVYTVTGTDGNSCKRSATVQVEVKICTGIDQTTDAALSIYPNPVLEELNIRFSGGDNTRVVFRNLLGQTVLSTELTPGEATINMSGISASIYVMELSTGDQTLIRKIVKE
jgi:PKD repeat protein